MSDSKISSELSAIIEDRLKISPDEEVNIIVTLNEGADLEDAKNKCSSIGLRIENVIPGPVHVIAGSVSVKHIPLLADLSEVKIIEYDSKVYAL